MAGDVDAKYQDDNGKRHDLVIMILEYTPYQLFDILNFTEKLEPILAMTYFHQLHSAISYMHQNGIIHRNIAPQNLLLDHKLNLKVWFLVLLFNQYHVIL